MSDIEIIQFIIQMLIMISLSFYCYFRGKVSGMLEVRDDYERLNKLNAKQIVILKRIKELDEKAIIILKKQIEALKENEND